MTNFKAPKKITIEVKVGDAFKCIKESKFFTKEWLYKVQSCSYDIGSTSTEVEFLGDDYDLHLVTQKFLETNFKKQ